MSAPVVLGCDKCLQEAQIDVAREEWVCSYCGHLNQIAYFRTPIARRILQKARREYLDNDYSMTIVFSAAALDAELARLFFAWRPLMVSGDEPYRLRMEEDLRNLGEPSERIEAVALLLDPGGIDAHVASQPPLAGSLAAMPFLRGLRLAKAYERRLFGPANAILHQGRARWEKADARTCFNLAVFGLETFKSLEASAQARIWSIRRVEQGHDGFASGEAS